MAIDPVATAQSWAGVKKGNAPGAVPAVPFGEFLSRSATQEQVSETTAAEILRLRMLSAAVSLGGDENGGGSSLSQSVQGLLDRFLEQLPESGADARDGAESAGAAEAGGTAGIGGAAKIGGAPEQAAETVGSAELDGNAAAQSRPNLSGHPLTEAIIQKASRRYGVDSGLIRAIIKAESNFNPRAVSSAGAQGLMQLMPATARGLGVTDSFDPEQNVMAGTRFLKDLLRRYNGNLDEALAAYNWGPANVDRHGSDRLPRETRDYLGKVKSYYAQNVG